jgi:hypothetical protein
MLNFEVCLRDTAKELNSILFDTPEIDHLDDVDELEKSIREASELLVKEDSLTAMAAAVIKRVGGKYPPGTRVVGKVQDIIFDTGLKKKKEHKQSLGVKGADLYLEGGIKIFRGGKVSLFGTAKNIMTSDLNVTFADLCEKLKDVGFDPKKKKNQIRVVYTTTRYIIDQLRKNGKIKDDEN